MPEHRYRYKFRVDSSYNYVFDIATSDPYDEESVKGYDSKLYKILSEIFHQRCSSKTSDQMKEFLRASKRSDKNSVIKLILDWNPSLGKIFPKKIKLSLLWIAVLSCYQNSAELLVRWGADVNERCGIKFFKNINKKTNILHLLLMTYPSSWNERFLGLVLEHGANFDARDSSGETPMHYAAIQGRVQAVRLLLEKGADVNVVNEDGRTSLLEAAANSKAEVASLLIEHGADVTVRDNAGMNVLHCLAFYNADVELVQLARVLIEKGASLDDRRHHGEFQPIHDAVLLEKNELVKLFLDKGANVNALAENDEFPLYTAAERKNPAVLRTLLERGADVDLKTADGETALHRACSSDYNSQEHIKILLSLGADMFVEDCINETPFALIRKRQIGNPRIKLMLRMLALKKACLQPSVELKDESIIKRYPELWTYYQDCVGQSRESKSTRFIGSCTFFELLTKCRCQIAPLTRNREFESGLKRCYRTVVRSYAAEISEAFECAKRRHLSMLEQEDVINEALYCILPHLIVTKVAHYVLGCEICKMKKIVQASRTLGSENLNSARED